MSSIITSVFKATIGLLVNKGRDTAAEKLKEGDVIDQKFRSLIVREIDDIKSKLDGLSRKDLLASMSFFREGIEILYDLFSNDVTSGSDQAEVTRVDDDAFSTVSASEKTVALTQRKRELFKFNESDIKTFAKANDRFSDARREATRAFNNESLKLPDRILAMKYRVMATILEALHVDHDYTEAFPACQVCLDELHALPEVRKNFEVQVKEGFMSRFGKEDRNEVISAVCQINEVIYAVFRCRTIFMTNWPCIQTGVDMYINPLCDERVSKALGRREQVEFNFQPLSIYGWVGEGDMKLKEPDAIATNSMGNLIVTDLGDGKVKIFNKQGDFLYSLEVGNFLTGGNAHRLAVATDPQDNIYVAVTEFKAVASVLDSSSRNKEQKKSSVLVFDKHGQHYKSLCLEDVKHYSYHFHLLAVDDKGTIFAGCEKTVWISTENGNFHRLLSISDIDDTSAVITGITSAGGDSLLLHAACGYGTRRFHFLTAKGERLERIDFKYYSARKLVSHHKGRYILIHPDQRYGRFGSFTISIYTKNGQLVNNIIRRTYLVGAVNFVPRNLAVTPNGNFAITDKNGRVVVW